MTSLHTIRLGLSEFQVIIAIGLVTFMAGRNLLKMPLYEFGCPTCGIQTTELYKMGENGELLTCSNCGHAGLMKQISGFVSPGVSGSGGGNCSPGCNGNCAGCH